jgi:FkbM family methyltransferase
MKIIYITPHLSTGGMPEYLRKKVELLKDDNDIWIIELGTEWSYRIIRDKIESLIGNRLIAVNGDFERMYEIIQEINPDIIHFEELSDYHIPYDILHKIYIPDRSYKIFETFHDSSIESCEKRFLPDKMLVVSPWQIKMMKDLGVPIEVINHEIDAGFRGRSGLSNLGLDLNKKHIMQVGLFSKRKNQLETFEIARSMPDVEFHFLGGLTDNYKLYWQSLIDDKPDNCTIWNERSDVYRFYECFDAVIFPSRGDYGDRETNPLVIRESIAWKIPLLVRDLPIYMGMYKKSDLVKFMSDDIKQNCDILYKLLNENKKINKMEIDQSFFKKKLFNIKFDPSDNKINFEYLESSDFECKVCIRDIDTEVPIYSFDVTFTPGISNWCVPIPIDHYDFQNNPNFGGFLYDFYDNSGNKVYSMSTRIKRSLSDKKKFRVESFDPLFVNYEQFFTDKIYSKFFSKIIKFDTVIDIGANVGLFTELALVSGANRVISVEINDKAIETFNKIHGDNKSVKLITTGISKEVGEIEIYIDPNNSLVSSVLHNHTTGLSNKNLIKVIGLNDLIESESLSEIDIIKIDVEGAEYDIFSGVSIENLKRSKFILMEFHDNFGGILRDVILNKLDEAGFKYELYQDDCVGLANDYEERGTIFAENTKPVSTTGVGFFSWKK